MRRLIRSRLIWISTVCKRVSEFTSCPNLPDFTLTVWALNNYKADQNMQIQKKNSKNIFSPKT